MVVSGHLRAPATLPAQHVSYYTVALPRLGVCGRQSRMELLSRVLHCNRRTAEVKAEVIHSRHNPNVRATRRGEATHTQIT